MYKEFYLIRHAESLGNIGFSDDFDPSLSPLGISQAHKTAEQIKPYCDTSTLLLSSPFERCLQTAEIVSKATQLQINIYPMLNELFLNKWYPLKKIRFQTLSKKAKKYNANRNLCDSEQWWPDNNETPAELSIRTSILRNRLLSEKFKANKIICISHWATIKSLIKAMIPDLHLDEIKNAGISKIVYENSSFKSIFINKTD